MIGGHAAGVDIDRFFKYLFWVCLDMPFASCKCVVTSITHEPSPGLTVSRSIPFSPLSIDLVGLPDGTA